MSFVLPAAAVNGHTGFRPGSWQWGDKASTVVYKLMCSLPGLKRDIVQFSDFGLGI